MQAQLQQAAAVSRERTRGLLTEDHVRMQELIKHCSYYRFLFSSRGCESFSSPG